jgi:hypothetical protein
MCIRRRSAHAGAYRGRRSSRVAGRFIVIGQRYYLADCTLVKWIRRTKLSGKEEPQPAARDLEEGEGSLQSTSPICGRSWTSYDARSIKSRRMVTSQVGLMLLRRALRVEIIP